MDNSPLLTSSSNHGSAAFDTPEPEPTHIRFENVSFEVNGKIILHRVNGLFRAGTMTAIIGPSGAGKSTLLNVLNGVIDEDKISGNILVNGDIR